VTIPPPNIQVPLGKQRNSSGTLSAILTPVSVVDSEESERECSSEDDVKQSELEIFDQVQLDLKFDTPSMGNIDADAVR
jgi:hypothetical protein